MIAHPVKILMPMMKLMLVSGYALLVLGLTTVLKIVSLSALTSQMGEEQRFKPMLTI